MRIVIDMQGAQTESRFRGIGRHTMSFAQAVVRNRGEHDVILALNGLFPETIEPIRAAFDGLLPQENIRVWHTPGPVCEMQPGNDARREAAELIREAFLASLQPDVIHICSLFEGYVDDAVTSIGRFNITTPVSVTLYDLIPLLNPEHYLKPNPSYERYYLCKVNYLRRSALFLSISEFSRKEAMDVLNIEGDKIVNVSTAIAGHFQPWAIDNAAAERILKKFHINRAFVLHSGSADERKNLVRLIQAYAALPASLLAGHQLVLAGKMPKGDVARLKDIAKSAGLKADELVFAGYVTDEELVQLYTLCRLYVFPSWHEGFGLPALEAMACGAPVIGANTSSLPEVIGLDEALFDPFNVAAIAAKMAQALKDDAFRAALREHGLQQAKKFSWDETAKRAIAAWEAWQLSRKKVKNHLPNGGRKPRLAFISPLPPERTGIADYSAELLPALSAYYDIELIVTQPVVQDPWINHYGHIRDLMWLRENAQSIDRVLYQMGNSPFHDYMLPLMSEIPGVVVLHDFYLGSLMSWLELNGAGHVWTQALYDSHGYSAVQARYRDAERAKWHYPANAHVLQHALGIIVHSEYARGLARQWYEADDHRHWRVVPHLRKASRMDNRLAARQHLGLETDDFLVCSFGFLGPAKLNHRLLQAWLKSPLASDKRCYLVFVGENHGDDYGGELLKTIRSSACGQRIRITGYAPTDLFRAYLAAADVAVQLRTHSRGETSGTVLDCMNYGLPVILNAHGTMAELDRGAAWMLSDEFADQELAEALEKLWRYPELRRESGKRAQEHIRAHHAPAGCAKLYAEAIETFYANMANGLPTLIHSLAKSLSPTPSDNEIKQLAWSLGRNHPLPRLKKYLYLDVTATCRNDLKTGIERVARALSLALLASPPEGYRVEPVYLHYENGKWLYRHARRYTLELLGCPPEALNEDIAEPVAGDVLIGLDLSGDMLVEAARFGLLEDMRNHGVNIYFIVYDLLPVRMPEVFPPNADEIHRRWLHTIATCDGAVCISKSVAHDLAHWLQEGGMQYEKRRAFKIGWFHLGADISNSAPSLGMPPDAVKTLTSLRARPTFLMVGTIEPRKGYLQTLDAFDLLWRDGLDVNLVIVGHEGWKSLPDAMRRNIPQTVSRLRGHPESGKRLFWLEGISDEYLEKVYAASTCLIAASYDEGFGLPLMEAAQHKLPIIARDIPVFREVAEDRAYYFSDTRQPEVLADALRDWLALYQQGTHPRSDNMPWLTWRESAERLMKIVLEEWRLGTEKAWVGVSKGGQCAR